MRRRLLWAAALLCGLGVWQSGEAAWIHAKAWLAYELIDRAWQRTLDGERSIVPWAGADFWPVAKLRAPSLERDLVVLSNASGRALAFGPGHLPESATPESRSHIVIAGHRDTHFSWLRDARPGDELQLQARDGEWRHYQIVGHFVITSDEVPAVTVEPKPLLTLVTCHASSPLGPTTGWLIVRAAPSTSEYLEERVRRAEL